jgi:hypothetical protein
VASRHRFSGQTQRPVSVRILLSRHPTRTEGEALFLVVRTCCTVAPSPRSALTFQGCQAYSSSSDWTQTSANGPTKCRGNICKTPIALHPQDVLVLWPRTKPLDSMFERRQALYTRILSDHLRFPPNKTAIPYCKRLVLSP